MVYVASLNLFFVLSMNIQIFRMYKVEELDFGKRLV